MPQEKEDLSRETFYPEGDPAEGVEGLETSRSDLLSRQQALKLAGAATLGGAFGMLGSQEAAYARRRRKARLAANAPGPHDNIVGTSGDARFAQVFINTFASKLTMAKLVVRKENGSTQGDWLIQLNMAVNNGQGVGTPISTVLASTIVPDGLVPEGVSTITARFALPAEVLANVWYALVVSRPGSNSVSVGYRADDPSPDKMFHSSGLSGNNFTSQPEEMVFSTYVL